MKLVIAPFVITVLLVSALAGVILLHNGDTADKHIQTAVTYQKVPNEPDQILNLPNQTEKAPSVKLETVLNERQVSNNLFLVDSADLPGVNIQYKSLWINGSITNTGFASAFNVGLHVEAYAHDGSIKIDLTVPLANAVYGTDKATDAFILSFPDFALTQDGVVCSDYAPEGSLQLGHLVALQLGTLEAGHTINIALAIYHEDEVSNWTVTPVWTTIPSL